MTNETVSTTYGTKREKARLRMGYTYKFLSKTDDVGRDIADVFLVHELADGRGDRHNLRGGAHGRGGGVIEVDDMGLLLRAGNGGHRKAGARRGAIRTQRSDSAARGERSRRGEGNRHDEAA